MVLDGKSQVHTFLVGVTVINRALVMLYCGKPIFWPKRRQHRRRAYKYEGLMDIFLIWFDGLMFMLTSALRTLTNQL